MQGQGSLFMERLALFLVMQKVAALKVAAALLI